MKVTHYTQLVLILSVHDSELQYKQSCDSITEQKVRSNHVYALGPFVTEPLGLVIHTTCLVLLLVYVYE